MRQMVHKLLDGSLRKPLRHALLFLSPPMATRALACAISFAFALSGCQAPTNPSPQPDTPGQSPYPPDTSVRSGPLEVVHEFNGPTPTGITLSHEGRIFVSFPRWEDPVPSTVVELRDGREVPYPDPAVNSGDSPETLLSVQSVVMDPDNRLWAVDSGNVNMGPIRGFEWPKLVRIDLATNRVVQTIHFPRGVVTENSFINDVRFDLRRGQGGMAFVTDSSGQGPNGIIVVDLASGHSWRKLNGDSSVEPDKNFVAVMEGEPLMFREPGKPPRPALMGSDGIAISSDGSRLFYCPLSSRRFQSVSVDALADENLPDDRVAATVRNEETREFASDGLESDAEGRLYLTDYEHNAVQVRTPDGKYQTLASDPRMWWPDTLSLATDGHLYVTCSQLHRQAKYHDGRDLRRRPFYLFRVPVDAKPVLLRR